MSETVHEEPRDIPGNPATVDRMIVVNPTDGATTVYEGTFPFLRDGGMFEITVPVGTEPVVGPPIEGGPLPDRPIEQLADREGPLTDDTPEHLLVCPLEGEQLASGTITVVAAHGEEIVIAVDSATYNDPPTDLDLDGEIDA